MADVNSPGVRIIQAARTTKTSPLLQARANYGIVNELVKEVLTEVPDADFLEIRAIRYDIEEVTDGGSATGVQDGQ